MPAAQRGGNPPPANIRHAMGLAEHHGDLRKGSDRSVVRGRPILGACAPSSGLSSCRLTGDDRKTSTSRRSAAGHEPEGSSHLRVSAGCVNQSGS